jgi:Cu-processing system permease protein
MSKTISKPRHENREVSKPCCLTPGSSCASIRGSGLAKSSGSIPGFMRQIRILAGKEFGDRFRSGWVLACVLVWLGAIGLAAFLGLLQIGRIGVQGYERTVMSLLNLVQYLIPLLGLLLGHDLVVGEREDRTLGLVIGGGVGRIRVLTAKFIGGCLTLSVPLILGFALAGTAIGLTARDSSVMPFVRLALSGMALGVIFLGLGLAISVFARTRIQALVLALLAWCVAVFAFDLVALAAIVSTKAQAAAQEVDLICDATHVNASSDLHSAFDVSSTPANGRTAAPVGPSLGWLAANPVDLFRVVNLPDHAGVGRQWFTIALSGLFWLALPFGAGVLKLRRSDL